MATLRVNYPCKLIISCRLKSVQLSSTSCRRVVVFAATGLSCYGHGEPTKKGNGGCQPEALQDDLNSRSLLPGGAAKGGCRPSGVPGITHGAIGIRPRGWWIAPSGRVFSMSDAKHEGYVGPNDPAYYAPRELRERATSEQPDTMLMQTDEWRPRMTTEGPPLQPSGKLPQRRQNSEMFTKAVAQAMQEQREPAPVEAPSVLRDLSGRRALFQHGPPLLDRGGDCGKHRIASRHGHPGFATPRKRRVIAFGHLAVGQILHASGAAAAATKAHGDLGRAGRQRARQRSAAARNSCRRSSSRRLRSHQWAAGRRAADVRQACRQRVARARDGNFRRIGHSVRRFRRPGAGDGGIA